MLYFLFLLTHIHAHLLSSSSFSSCFSGLNPAAGVEDLHIDGCFSQISLKSDPELQIHLLLLV